MVKIILIKCIIVYPWVIDNNVSVILMTIYIIFMNNYIIFIYAVIGPTVILKNLEI